MNIPSLRRHYPDQVQRVSAIVINEHWQDLSFIKAPLGIMTMLGLFYSKLKQKFKKPFFMGFSI